MQYTRYEPFGFTGDSEIPNARSLTDYAAQCVLHSQGLLRKAPSTKISLAG
jgi:hypothetical protein